MRTLAAAGALWVTFLTPADWQCLEREGCVVCRNVSDHPSDVLVHDDASGPPRAERLQPASVLRVCSPSDRTAGSPRGIPAAG